jgi:hypothetical protein
MQKIPLFPFVNSDPPLLAASVTQKSRFHRILKFGAWSLFGVWCLVLGAFSCAHAATISESFSTNPTQNGWQVFGNSNLFNWNSASQQLAVTWDSTQPNSYFYHFLPWYLTRYDDFRVEFDLRLTDIASGVETNKTGPLQLGFGFLNYAGATSTNFMRGVFGSAPNVAEFDYFAHGYYIFGQMTYDSPADTQPAFISVVDSFAYSPTDVSVYDYEIPTNQPVHVIFSYNGSNQTATVSVAATNGLPGQFPDLVLNPPNGFKATDDFHVDIFSISSYSSAGDDFDSVFADGTVDNLVVTLAPPAQNLHGGFVNGLWQLQFSDHLNWNYTLERTTNWTTWIPVTLPVSGNGTNLTLVDTNAPDGSALYRVSASRP